MLCTDTQLLLLARLSTRRDCCCNEGNHKLHYYIFVISHQLCFDLQVNSHLQKRSSLLEHCYFLFHSFGAFPNDVQINCNHLYDEQCDDVCAVADLNERVKKIFESCSAG